MEVKSTETGSFSYMQEDGAKHFMDTVVRRSTVLFPDQTPKSVEKKATVTLQNFALFADPGLISPT